MFFPIKSSMVTEEHFRGDCEEDQIALTRANSRLAACTIGRIVVAVTVAADEEIWSFWTVVRLVENLPHKRLVGNLPHKGRWWLSGMHAHPQFSRYLTMQAGQLATLAWEISTRLYAQPSWWTNSRISTSINVLGLQCNKCYLSGQVEDFYDTITAGKEEPFYKLGAGPSTYLFH
jgi:hypothetical protein